MRRLLLAWFVLSGLSPGPSQPAAGQEVPLAPELHYTLLAKTLSFDRALDRFGPELVIAVIYQDEYPESNAVRREFLHAARNSPIRSIGNRPVRVVAIRPTSEVELAARLRLEHVDVLFIGPLRAQPVQAVLAAARSHHAATISCVPEHADAGVGVVLSARAGRPHLRVNLRSSRAEGSEYGAQLLKLAEVVEER